MKKSYPKVLFLAALCCALVYIGMYVPGCKKAPERAEFKNLSTVAGLQKHSLEFTKRVEKVSDKIYVAIGFGLANSIMIEGDDGVIIVDTLESMESAQAVYREFKKITKKPVAAIIYTHFHPDHVFGAGVFADHRQIPVYAHNSTSALIDKVVSVIRPIITKRSMRMFGCFLPDDAIVNAGIGMRLNIDKNSHVGVVRPNHTFADTLSDTVAGIRFTLVHAPGETPDQIFVWLPDEKTILSGDNIYKTFPNLYTIRGTSFRDVKKWVASLDKMRAYHPDFLVPSHTEPIRGADRIYRTLTDYRDAIEYVHDQTVRGMNMGMTPDELVGYVKLPERLAASPYLKEYYGTMAWSVRSVFDGYLGWFDGNPTNLFPLSPKDTAQHMADLAGGADVLEKKAEEADRKGDFQWVLNLTDQLLALDPKNSRARKLRIRALTALGEKSANPNARHYYLTRAAELGQGLVIGELGHPTPEMVHSLPLNRFFDSMAVNLDPEKSADVDMKVGFIFPDTGEKYTIAVRHGVCEITPDLVSKPDITVTVESVIWKEMLAKLRRPLVTIATEFDISGGKVAFLKFMAMFDPVYDKPATS
ncbi:MAG: MBL fold metallo-hydrolase [Deltaproteobacteria bacterium]|nr:MBL fold metallo-hydrolase [Deltaproteobacteria bacterium]